MLSASTKSAARTQVRDIIQQHLTILARWTNASGTPSGAEHIIIEWLEALSGVCDVPRCKASPEQVQSATTYLGKLTDFLKLMNQDLSNGFQHTPIGYVWSQAQVWCAAGKSFRSTISRDQVWDLIHPAIPDSLEDLGNGVFQATWAAPVPFGDIPILTHIESIDVIGDIFEPDALPNGLAVQFRVVDGIPVSHLASLNAVQVE